jgi:hypothetical protein
MIAISPSAAMRKSWQSEAENLGQSVEMDRPNVNTLF